MRVKCATERRKSRLTLARTLSHISKAKSKADDRRRCFPPLRAAGALPVSTKVAAEVSLWAPLRRPLRLLCADSPLTISEMFANLRLSALRAPNTARLMSSSSSANKRSLADKVAVVTASTDGIGFAVARRLAKDGARVVVSSRSVFTRYLRPFQPFVRRKRENVEKAVQTLQSEGLTVSGVVCHVSKHEDRKRLLDQVCRPPPPPHASSPPPPRRLSRTSAPSISSSRTRPSTPRLDSFSTYTFSHLFLISLSLPFPSDLRGRLRQSMPSLPFAALTRLSPQILSLNVKSAFMLTKEFVPHIRRNGSIVYMSSIGAYQPFALIG
ncbi:unnamed protein product, partial [Oppiella nova]